MFVLDYTLNVLSERVIINAAKYAVVSALLAVIFKVTDDDLEWNYLRGILPDDKVFGIFASSTSFFLVFRSVQSFNMFREGARNVYQMSGAWFDSASTLMAFTRSSKADEQEVMNFRSTLVRLFSLLSMLCLTELENCEDAYRGAAINFPLIDLDKLDKDILELIRTSHCKVEAVAQIVQCLIVDHQKSGVLAVPPPILTRAFQDLGSGMLKYHEALNISHTPAPFPLKAMTALLLFITAVYTPLMMAVWNPGPISAAWTTFVQVLVFFTLNFLSSEVENPFRGDTKDVNIQSVHYNMNQRLLELNKISTDLTQKSVTSISSVCISPSYSLDQRHEDSLSEREIAKSERKSKALKTVIDQFIHRTLSFAIEATETDPRASQTSSENRSDTDDVCTLDSTMHSSPRPNVSWPELPADLVQECETLGHATQPVALKPRATTSGQLSRNGCLDDDLAQEDSGCSPDCENRSQDE